MSHPRDQVLLQAVADGGVEHGGRFEVVTGPGGDVFQLEFPDGYLAAGFSAEGATLIDESPLYHLIESRLRGGSPLFLPIFEIRQDGLAENLMGGSLVQKLWGDHGCDIRHEGVCQLAGDLAFGFPAAVCDAGGGSAAHPDPFLLVPLNPRMDSSSLSDGLPDEFLDACQTTLDLLVVHWNPVCRSRLCFHVGSILFDGQIDFGYLFGCEVFPPQIFPSVQVHVGVTC